MNVNPSQPVRVGDYVNVAGDAASGKVISTINMDRWVPSIEVKFKNQDYSKSISPVFLNRLRG